MERKNAWEKYPEGEKEKQYFASRKIIVNLFQSVRQNASVWIIS